MKLWREIALVACVGASVMALAIGGGAARGADVGIVSNIKIMSDKNPDDVSSPEAWKKSYIKDGMTDQEKAIAIWKTVVKYRHQDTPPGEGLEGGKGYGNVHDPIKTFNVYGYGMCCCAASNIEGLARYIGMPARGRQINLHSVPEVWYNNSWHLLDASLMFYLIKPDDGLIASVDEMKKSIADWRKDHPEFQNATDLKNFSKNEGWKKGPPLFATCQFYDKDGINRAGWHGWWSNMGEYNYKIQNSHKIVVPPDTQGEVNIYDYGAMMGYKVNVQLREGEKLTRCWHAKDIATGLNRNGGKRFEKFLEGDMTALGQQRDFGDLSPGRIGNGLLEYDAMADSKLASTALTFDNLKLDGGKLRAVDASKPATLIVRMPCSYVYFGGEMTCNPIAAGVKASLSLNNGLDWMPLAAFEQAGEQKTDLKPLIFNKYDYRVKLEFPAGSTAGLDALKFVNHVQLSQAPLPIITEGDNKLTFSAAQPEGTITVEANMNGDPETPLGKTMTIADFHPILNGANIKRFAIGTTADADAKAAELDDLSKVLENPPLHGSAIVPVTTPGDITRVRFAAHWRARNNTDGYVVSASFDAGKTWKEMAKFDLANSAKSGYFVFTDVPANSRTVQVKFDGTQSHSTEIFDLRIDVDYKEPAGGFRPVKITYAWEEGVPPALPPAKGKAAPAEKPHGTPKTAEHICYSPEETWTIHCGPGTVVKSYTVELAK
ncbi:MAG: hypothetical protein FWD61_01950 [Phycisphaerales bacterium]|nr:hypothetical protein [Phycisphaerales bacterium]